MLDFCGEHGLGADIEVIPAMGINDAYERVLASNVRYRFVIDVATICRPAKITVLKARSPAARPCGRWRS